MCTTYSNLCNQKIIATLHNKRKVVSLQKELATAKSFKLKDLKVESLVRTLHVLIVQLMILNEENIEDFTMHCD